LNFSFKNRDTFIQQAVATEFDVLVIGGGITGTGIALDAASRGLKVVLIEMQDFAGGTSGRSTKLIHGGLRYLKQFSFKLVAEMGKEREIIHQIAPHLTKPAPMLLPIVKQGSLGKFSSTLGMWLYEWLAGVKKEERHRNLTYEETLAAEPLLGKNNLLGGILFYEYATDDARLTLEIIKEAVSRGTIALNYTKLISFEQKQNTINGAKALDLLSGKEFEIKAKYIVNAAGPWVEEINDLDKQRTNLKLHITKGVHLVVDQKKLPVKQALYFDTYDERMIFVIPRDGKTYIGTTDTFYSGDLKDPKLTKEDRDYLLKCVNIYFPENKISANDIESHWVGLRPLIDKPGKKPSEISRKDETFQSTSGLITIAGGKLTGYRKMAKRIVDTIADKIHSAEGKKIPECSTDRIKLSGGKIISSLEELMKSKLQEGLSLGLSESEISSLINRYGSNINELYTIASQLKNTKHELPLFLQIQLIYAIENEMCVSPCDFFIRRTGMLYFDINSVKQWKNPVILYIKDKLLWTDELTRKFELELQTQLENKIIK
jgi:glycerol-3-phosphate dehydrogenase